MKSPSKKRKPAGPGEVEAGFQTALIASISATDFAKATVAVKVRTVLSAAHTAACWVINGAAAVLFAGSLVFRVLGGGYA